MKHSDTKELVLVDECWNSVAFMAQVQRWLKISAHPDRLYFRYKGDKLDALVVGPGRELRGMSYRPVLFVVTPESS